MKIVFCYTVAGTFGFAKETIVQLRNQGDEIILISSKAERLKSIASELNVAYKAFDFSRKMNPIGDIKGIIALCKYLSKINPDIVIGATPKGALISMVASALIRVRCRVYHIFGFPFETQKGLNRQILMMAERLTALCATHVLPISHSVGEKGVQLKLVKVKKLHLTDALTIGGVDTTRFNPDIVDASTLKEKYNYNDKDFIIGFVGRLTVDKGIFDYMTVVEKLSQQYHNIRCLIIGGNDERCPINKEKFDTFLQKQNAIYIEHTGEIEKYMKLMDVMLQPSYREGFGNANVEVQSMRVPVVCYKVTGCVDSVLDGKTGFMAEYKDTETLYNSVVKLIEDKELRKKMGAEGRIFVEKNYSRERVAVFNRDYLNSIAK